eukprot:CAMPEP_0119042108 /NCGR_PEP_ID=MMETSP1177-20130426/14359_1 /TAXON_ID=2985 /ORGANISM="Ochromonas sp, Strain CCMP1899" /LENGTH=167 /DNA_ID=CAMNT_0007008653 /DNA_START=169 /DNA_END=672 /DNA_ORIENTATION=-
MMAEKSKALPFLSRPEKLDGSMIGDNGFDPLGISNTIPSLNYARAAELKHGRVAMLATVGWVFQQYVHFVSAETDPLKVVTALGYGPNLQILLAIGCVELATWDDTFTSTTPGDFGFDPMSLLKGKNEKQVNELKLKEIKNGRLAMVAITGMFVQNLAVPGVATLSF